VVEERGAGGRRSLLVAVCAKIKVDIGPVPLTMQTLAVLMIGAAYGARLGMATMLLYLAEGVAGLPVFAGPSLFGLGYLLGADRRLSRRLSPGGGAGRISGRAGLRPELPADADGDIARGGAHPCSGVLWLSTFFGIEKAVAVGLMPFIIGDVIKAALAALAFPIAWRVIERFKGDAGQPPR
jgi:biotin transport system substrate-specific component